MAHKSAPALPPSATPPPPPATWAAQPSAQPASLDPHSPLAADTPPPEDDADDAPLIDDTFFLFSAVPSWLISMVVHLIVLLGLSLLSFRADDTKRLAPTLEIGTEMETEPAEELLPQIVDAPSTAVLETPIEPQPLVEEIVVEDIVQSVSTDTDAAPLAIDLDPLGESTAPLNARIQEYGAYAGTGLEGRGAASRADLLRAGGGTPGSEAAVAGALAWLARHQNADGSWSWDHSQGECQHRCANPGTLDARNGATGLALLPFLGAGNTHLEGQYKENVRAGLEFLLRNMTVQKQGMGSLLDAGTMYSHGICSIALCEAYAMTQDKDLAQPAQLALNFIVYAQDPVGGGWRYQPQTAGDTSVLGWQLMALKSGHMGYLNVPAETVMGASRFLDAVQAESGAVYGYTAPGPGTATTAVGLLCRMYLGWKHDHPALERGVEALAQQGPSMSNLYYDYYATQVMHHFGGEKWNAWNEVMRDSLIAMQSREGHQDGSWFVQGDVGAASGGRLYCTAMCAMILEVYYRHMPIYSEQAAEDDFPL